MTPRLRNDATSPAEEAAAWQQRCAECGRSFPLFSLAWHCDCGGLLTLDSPPPISLLTDALPWSIWRYEPVLPPFPLGERVSLGEGMTPVVPLGEGVWAKVDYLNPTLSFKDRGATLLLTAARAAGATRVVTDSSGNAGTAVAAYAAHAGLPAEIWVPETTPAGKLAGMRAHGADVRVASGDRAAAAAGAARRVEETGAYYASHVYQPLFAHGVKTFVFEVWEQLGGRLPDAFVVPAGNGTLVLGCAHAVADLSTLGLIERRPAIVAVQASRCAPLAGLEPTGTTVADGIAIAAPPRAEEVVAAVGASGGAVVTVDDAGILAAQADLAGRGLWVEPTAAAAWAAWRDGAGDGPSGRRSAVVMLCGAGLKAAKGP